MSVYGNRLSIDQRVSFYRACAGEWPLARISSFLCVFFLSLMFGQDNSYELVYECNFPKIFPEQKYHYSSFFWLWFYSSLDVRLFFLLLFIFPAEIHCVCTDNILKNVEFHLLFLFSVYLSIFMCSFNFNYICFYWLSPIFFSFLSSDQIVV